VQAVKQSGGGEKTVPSSANTPSPNSNLDPKIAEALAGLNKEDRSLVDSQKYCAVMTDSLLGSMGAPLKVEVNGKAVFLCCKGCKTMALRDSDATLATVAKLRSENGVEH
jgi:hypothetical protein